MSFNNVIIKSAKLYYPENNKALQFYIDQENLNVIIVNFDTECNITSKYIKLSKMVINAIARMSEHERELESERFFLYLISHPRGDIKEYLQPLLNYFHMIGYLKFKKNIYNENKQTVVRYKVEFKNKDGKPILIKCYSSLSQLSDDIGKKMTSLHYQLFKLKV